MNEKQYLKAIERLLKYYEKIEKKYIHQQESSGMIAALQHEKNERLAILAKRYHESKDA